MGDQDQEQLDQTHPLVQLLAKPLPHATQVQRNHYRVNANRECDCNIRPLGTRQRCMWCSGKYEPLAPRHRQIHAKVRSTILGKKS